MNKEIRTAELKPGDVVALPFGKKATVKSVEVGREYIWVDWQEPYQTTKYGRYSSVLLEGDQ